MKATGMSAIGRMGVAFADWAGLRSMTELEYEKACRGPLEPVAGEYAFGTNEIYLEEFLMTTRKWLTSVMMIAFLATAQSRSATAALVAYDGFGNGTQGLTLNGQGGGTGFSSSWSFSSYPDNQLWSGDIQPGSPNYFYPPNVPLTYTSGCTQRKFVLAQPSIGTRTLSSGSVDLSVNSEYYFSFIFRDFAATPNNETVFTFANATSQLGFGWGYNDRFRIGTMTAIQKLHQGSFTDAGFASAGNTTYFVVGKVVASAAGTDQVFLKAYRSATDLVHSSANELSGFGSGADQWTVGHSFTSSAIFDRVGIVTEGNEWATLDEFRYGTTWMDVTGMLPKGTVISIR